MDSTRLLQEQSIYSNKPQVNGVSTSFDNSILSLATGSGFKLFRMDTFAQVSDNEDIQGSVIGPIKLAIPFYQSQLIFLIGKSSTTPIRDSQLVVWNDMRKAKEATLSFKESLINATVCKEGLFIAFEKSLLVLDVITLSQVYSISNISNSINSSIYMAMHSDTLVLLNVSQDNTSTLKITKIKCDKHQLKAKLEVSIKTPFKSVYKMALNDKGSLAFIVGNPKNRAHVYSIDSLAMLYCFRLESPFTQLITVSIGKKGRFVSVLYTDNFLELYQLREGHKKICKCLDNTLAKQNSAWEKVKDVFKTKQQYFARYKLGYASADGNMLSANECLNGDAGEFIVQFVKMSELMIVDSRGITGKIKFNSKEKGMVWAYKEIIWREDNRLVQIA